MLRDKVKLRFCFRTIYRNLQAEFELSEITFYKRARPVRSGKYISNTVRIIQNKKINNKQTAFALEEYKVGPTVSQV
jgi:hypothetical protein